MANSLNRQSTATARVFTAVTKADADLPGGICRALLVGTAGDANLMDAEGNIVTGVPLQAGFNQLSCKQVRTGGTAATIFALY
jgi:hypothetical protein